VSLRNRIAAVAALAVAGVVVAVAIAVYIADRSELRGQIDKSLTAVADRFGTFRAEPPPGGGGEVGRGFDDRPPEAPAVPFGGAPGYVQFINSDGRVIRPPDETKALPVDQRAITAARKGEGRYFTDKTVDGVHLRVLTTADGQGGALQIARPLTEVDHSLNRLLLILVIVGIAGIASAAVLGAVVARAALGPIARFTSRTETLTADPDPSERLEVEGDDELARLARSFNATLDALERSVESQRHLVADASHELRTPIASLRANIQMLGDADRLPEAEREALRADIIEELDALTALVGDVVDLARGAEAAVVVDDVALDEIIRSALRKARRRANGIRFAEELEPTLVRADPERVERAVVNLLDNAIKWSPPGGQVEVGLRDGLLSVRDEGKGFDEKDLPHVFDRFYRADEARKQPGSGLGLAIVRQATEAHGGWVRAGNDPRGGAKLEVFFGPPQSVPAPPVVA
jgi:two-component system sensor histidine kinase MprB